MLDDLDDGSNHSQQASVALTADLAKQLFEEYKMQLLAEKKSLPHENFCRMKVQVLPPDELRLICPDDMVHVMARNYRSPLQDFFKVKLNSIVRITTEMIPDESFADSAPKILSKSEMYEAMVRMNPFLEKLKESTGMHLEF